MTDERNSINELISFDELSRHYPDRSTPLREATRRALVAFLFLAALSAIVVVILDHVNK